jgi:hypothetical protein
VRQSSLTIGDGTVGQKGFLIFDLRFAIERKGNLESRIR